MLCSMHSRHAAEHTCSNAVSHWSICDPPTPTKKKADLNATLVYYSTSVTVKKFRYALPDVHGSFLYCKIAVSCGRLVPVSSNSTLPCNCKECVAQVYRKGAKVLPLHRYTSTCIYAKKWTVQYRYDWTYWHSHESEIRRQYCLYIFWKFFGISKRVIANTWPGKVKVLSVHVETAYTHIQQFTCTHTDSELVLMSRLHHKLKLLMAQLGYPPASSHTCMQSPQQSMNKGHIQSSHTCTIKQAFSKSIPVLHQWEQWCYGRLESEVLQWSSSIVPPAVHQCSPQNHHELPQLSTKSACTSHGLTRHSQARNVRSQIFH